MRTRQLPPLRISVKILIIVSYQILYWKSYWPDFHMTFIISKSIFGKQIQKWKKKQQRVNCTEHLIWCWWWCGSHSVLFALKIIKLRTKISAICFFFHRVINIYFVQYFIRIINLRMKNLLSPPTRRINPLYLWEKAWHKVNVVEKCFCLLMTNNWISNLCKKQTQKKRSLETFAFRLNVGRCSFDVGFVWIKN